MSTRYVPRDPGGTAFAEGVSPFRLLMGTAARSSAKLRFTANMVRTHEFVSSENLPSYDSAAVGGTRGATADGIARSVTT